mmetsp:Transcript_55668/g.120254  ORF Transcript_55668/g.120254 Transcript_55668/m.120254 type:complete len:273 (-) Transcript_55668:3-821(-)
MLSSPWWRGPRASPSPPSPKSGAAKDMQVPLGSEARPSLRGLTLERQGQPGIELLVHWHEDHREKPMTDGGAEELVWRRFPRMPEAACSDRKAEEAPPTPSPSLPSSMLLKSFLALSRAVSRTAASSFAAAWAMSRFCSSSTSVRLRFSSKALRSSALRSSIFPSRASRSLLSFRAFARSLATSVRKARSSEVGLPRAGSEALSALREAQAPPRHNDPGPSMYAAGWPAMNMPGPPRWPGTSAVKDETRIRWSHLALLRTPQPAKTNAAAAA